MRTCRSPGMKGAGSPGGGGGIGLAVAGPARGTPAAITAMAVERRKSLVFRMPRITQGTGQGLGRESSELERATAKPFTQLNGIARVAFLPGPMSFYPAGILRIRKDWPDDERFTQAFFS